jgi:arylsulfatase A-like enzyme
MHIVRRRLLFLMLFGAWCGAAAWSAYAVTEFVFTSVVYRLTRPYAVFPAWHWPLTVLVLLGHLMAGLMAGALAGLITGWVRRGAPDRDAIESAGTMALVLALLVNGAGEAPAIQTGAGCVFLLLVGLDLRAKRFGWLTHAWIVSVAWLGIGYASAILRIGMASQLGKRTDLAAAALAAAILLLAAAAMLAGRRWRHYSPALRFASCGAALVLLAVSAVLSLPVGRVVSAQSPAIHGAPGRPNLVLIVMDTVRADHLSLYGYARDTTPRLKELAADSVAYTNAFSASDITLTSHASIFTGMYPSWHGAYSQPPGAPYGRELSAQTPTLAELLRREGYETLGVAANLYLRADFGLERGFDAFRIPRPVPLLPGEDRTLLRYPLRRALSLVADTSQFDRLFTFGQDVNRELFAALDRRARPNAPFFAFVNYMDAHFPYVPPAPYDRLFPGKRAEATQETLGREIAWIARGRGATSAYREHCESQYDGGIAYMDAQIGQVVDRLKRHGVYEQTMIVVTSDHGEAFGEKHRTGHANSPYQNLLHTVLLVKYPGAARRGVETAPVSLIDIAPTALTALGVAAPAAMQGVALGNGAPAPRRIFAETFANPVAHSPDCPDGCVTKVLVEWPLKFVDNRTNGRSELFDLALDPGETHNLFATQRERAAVIGGRLAAWTAWLPAQAVEVKRVNPAIENTLRGNGYVSK